MAALKLYAQNDERGAFMHVWNVKNRVEPTKPNKHNRIQYQIILGKTAVGVFRTEARATEIFNEIRDAFLFAMNQPDNGRYPAYHIPSI